MKQHLGADGDFAYAYVIAHEVGHHVEYQTGILQDVHEKMARLSQAEANKLSVRLELLADFYAGVWAHHDNERFGSLEDGDIGGYSLCSSYWRRLSAEEGSWLCYARVVQSWYLKTAHEVVQAWLGNGRCVTG